MTDGNLNISLVLKISYQYFKQQICESFAIDYEYFLFIRYAVMFEYLPDFFMNIPFTATAS